MKRLIAAAIAAVSLGGCAVYEPAPYYAAAPAYGYYYPAPAPSVSFYYSNRPYYHHWHRW